MNTRANLWKSTQMAQKPIRQEKWAGQKDMGCGGSWSTTWTDSWVGGHGSGPGAGGRSKL